MRFGAFTIADTYPTDPRSFDRDPVREAVELAVHSERLGFDQFWVGEHHFHRSGAIASPAVVLAAAAARTRRIRLGPLVAVLPFHDPIRLAEAYATLDRLSNGRLELAVGSGYMGREFRGFGLDPAARSVDFAERLPRLVAALRGEPVQTRPTAPPVSLNVDPVQRPHPPLWVAAGRPASIRDVGRRGHGIALIPYATLSDIDELPETVRSYRRSLPRDVEPRVLAAFHVAVGDRDRPVRRLQRFLDSRLDPEDARLAAHRSQHPDLGVAGTLADRGLTLIGAPAELRERVHWLEEIGVTEIAGIFDFGGAPFEETVRSMQGWAGVAALAEGSVGLTSADHENRQSRAGTSPPEVPERATATSG
ncbi:MAG: LLM class flavin-dependent oxidoreductase [Thermoplasmata archaeon]|nr:LLM class flavin-dependent oxidoreductase [Thermoplasmata archaeon]